MQPIAPNSAQVDIARSFIVDTKAFAANLANAPDVDTRGNMDASIHCAGKSATSLYFATWGIDRPDLCLALEQVLEGKQLLEQTVIAYGLPPEEAMASIKQLASKAIDAFDGAIEIIDND